MSVNSAGPGLVGGGCWEVKSSVKWDRGRERSCAGGRYYLEGGEREAEGEGERERGGQGSWKWGRVLWSIGALRPVCMYQLFILFIYLFFMGLFKDFHRTIHPSPAFAPPRFRSGESVGRRESQYSGRVGQSDWTRAMSFGRKYTNRLSLSFPVHVVCFPSLPPSIQISLSIEVLVTNFDLGLSFPRKNEHGREPGGAGI